MLAKGTIVRGNWSKLEYKVEHSGSCEYGGWVMCRSVDNHLQTGSFSYLGKRVGNEIMITDTRRPKDRLIIVKEKKKKKAQMTFDFTKKKRTAGKPLSKAPPP